MRIGLTVFVLLLTAGASAVSTQTSPPSPAQGPRYDVVSIKLNQASAAGRFENPTVIQRPDGGFTQTRVSIGALVARAYSAGAPGDMVGLPDWAMREYYDVSATSTLTKVTAEDRTAMLRAMLADRVKLAVHFEKREQPVYDLALARSDGKLGSGLTAIDADCAAKLAADRAAAEAAVAAGTPPPRPQMPDFSVPPPPCTLRVVGLALRDRQAGRPGNPLRPGDLMEGEATMETLAQALRLSTARLVVDKTGLRGSYRIAMTFDGFGSRRGPDIAPAADAMPTVFVAIREQLGLELKSSKAELDTLVIDRLERPTEN
jgi:uncharacterized protein (TIGR03435 family)